MKVTLLPSAPDTGTYQFLTTFLINETVAIDAGCLGFCGGPREQARIQSVFISHSHTDHVCSLPIFLMNIEDEATAPLAVYSHADVLDSLRTDVFNGRVWPDFLKFTRNGSPLATLTCIASGEPVSVGALTVTPIAVNHVVRTFGFLVDDGRSVVAFSSDSGPTDEIWAVARSHPCLKAVFMGVAFPDYLGARAAAAGHLTPQLAKVEIGKLPAGVEIFAIHLKASHRRDVVRELQDLRLPNLAIADPGREYCL